MPQFYSCSIICTCLAKLSVYSSFIFHDIIFHIFGYKGASLFGLQRLFRKQKPNTMTRIPASGTNIKV